MKVRPYSTLPRTPALSLFTVLATLLFLSGCYTVPETGRRSLSLMPEASMAALGRQSFSAVKQEVDLIRSGEQYEMVQRVGRRMVEVVGDRVPHADWEFILIDDDSVNAWAMPGGKIGVHTGLFKVAETEEELAFIIGHEIAHVTARHANSRISQALLIAGIGVGVNYSIRDMGQAEQALIMGLYGVGTTVGVALPYGRSQESEADYMGMIYMARAGYDPRVAAGVWRKMESASPGGAPPEWLSTHPSHNRRARDLREALPRAIKEYERATGKVPGETREREADQLEDFLRG